jgi:hypothetical protein
MTTRRSSRSARQAVELALAVPQVVAHRTLRMALAGAPSSARDKREFWLMGYEKMLAFNESWAAMFAEAARANQQIAWSMMRAAWFPWLYKAPTLRAMATRLQKAALDVAATGVGPVHKRAVANAKRLGRAKLR